MYIYIIWVGTKIHAAALWGLVPALEEAGPSLQVVRDWLLPIHAQVQWITLQNVIYWKPEANLSLKSYYLAMKQLQLVVQEQDSISINK